jgi:excisionase family DNA binding protein
MSKKVSHTSVAPTPQNFAARGLRIQDAAAYLSVTVCYVRALISTSELPHIRAGKRLIVDRHDLDAWLEARKQKAQREVLAS